MSATLHVRGHHNHQAVPKPALWAALALLVVSTALAAAARKDVAAEEARGPAAPALAERMLRFEDRPDGSIAVLDAASSTVTHVLAPEGHGFIRGVMRGMFRARKLDGASRDAPFRLAREADGRLTLTDPLTQRRVDLQAFGASNTAAFEALLHRTEVARAR